MQRRIGKELNAETDESQVSSELFLSVFVHAQKEKWIIALVFCTLQEKNVALGLVLVPPQLGNRMLDANDNKLDLARGSKAPSGREPAGGNGLYLRN